MTKPTVDALLRQHCCMVADQRPVPPDIDRPTVAAVLEYRMRLFFKLLRENGYAIIPVHPKSVIKGQP